MNKKNRKTVYASQSTEEAWCETPLILLEELYRMEKLVEDYE